MKTVIQFLKDNGLSAETASLMEEKMSGQMYSTGFISEETAGDILSMDPNQPGGIDLDSIALQLYLERSGSEGVPYGTHNASQILSLETDAMAKREKISKEEAKQRLTEELLNYAEIVGYERGAPAGMDLKYAFFGKRKVSKAQSIKKEPKGISFALDLTDYNRFVEAISKVELITKKDLSDLKKVVYDETILNDIGEAVKDTIVEEYFSDKKKLMETYYGRELMIKRNLMVHYYSVLIELSTDISIALETTSWFSEKVLAGSLNNELRQYLADLNIVGRINDIIRNISSQFDMYLDKLVSLSLDIKSLIENVKNIPEGKLTYQILLRTATSNLSPMSEKIDETVFGFENFILRLQGGSMKNRNIISGSSIYKGISNAILRLRKGSAKITEFLNSSPEENIGEMKSRAGVAKLDSAYKIESSFSGNKAKYIFSVTDRVVTSLLALGMDKDTAEMIKSLVSRYVYGRPGLIPDVDFFISDRVVKNVEGAI